MNCYDTNVTMAEILTLVVPPNNSSEDAPPHLHDPQLEENLGKLKMSSI